MALSARQRHARDGVGRWRRDHQQERQTGDRNEETVADARAQRPDLPRLGVIPPLQDPSAAPRYW